MKTKRIISWNVNGIRAVQRKGSLKELFDLNADIFCLQETKINEETLTEEISKINGYNSHFSSAEKKGYSGVAIYSKITAKSIRKGFGIDKFDNEGRIIISDYGTFYLLNIYYPNGKASAERLQYKMDFYEAFLDYVEALRKEGKPVIICGDVNTAHHEIDIARPKENVKVSGFLPIERAWMDKFISHGYIDTFRYLFPEEQKYTWWDQVTRARERNVGWRIDYFYINEEFKDRLINAFILNEFMGSDHCPIGIDIILDD